MNFKRRLVTVLLGGGAVLATAVAVTALRQEGGLSPNPWAAVAASLAVVAAVVSAWTSNVSSSSRRTPLSQTCWSRSTGEVDTSLSSSSWLTLANQQRSRSR